MRTEDDNKRNRGIIMVTQAEFMKFPKDVTFKQTSYYLEEERCGFINFMYKGKEYKTTYVASTKQGTNEDGEQIEITKPKEIDDDEWGTVYDELEIMIEKGEDRVG
jgi:hypothetical protein